LNEDALPTMPTAEAAEREGEPAADGSAEASDGDVTLQEPGLVSGLSAYYLRQGGCVFVAVCVSVCLFVGNFAQKLPNGFA